MTYDAANQATQYTAGGTTTGITYDNQGNRLTGPAPTTGTSTYVWDQANRLTSANGTSFTYDGTGLRASRTPSMGTSQSYTWDTVGPVPLMLADGALSYIYDAGGNPVEHIDATGSVTYYQHDQYGSTRLLTDSTGGTTAAFTFDAYGGLTAKTGAGDSVLRWNGQAQEADSGLYYLRNRYFDPTTAQFINMDLLAAATRDIYAYANNNPLNMSDPLGLWSWNPFEWSGQEWDTVGAVAGTVALGAAIVGATVLTGGVAGAVIVAIGTTASVVSTSISVVGAVNDCNKGFTEDCGWSVAGAVLGLAGFRLGSFMAKTAWTSKHVDEAWRAGARVAWGAANLAGPLYDGANYVRKYC